MPDLRLDHVIIVVRDLKSAVQDYTALGFHVLPGGEHPAFNTHNALIPFADGSYLELLATKEAMYFSYLQAALARDILDDELPDDTLPTRRFMYTLARGEGVQDFALMTDDLERTITSAKVGGVLLEAPIAGGRTRADGVQLAWEFVMARAGKLPFLIRDITPREQRVPTDAAVTTHPNGTSGIEGVEINLPDMAVQAKDYIALIGDPLSRSSVHALFKLNDGSKILLRQAAEFSMRVVLRNPHTRKAQIGFGALG